VNVDPETRSPGQTLLAGAGAHFKDALNWSRSAEVSPVSALACGLAIALPLLAGVTIGNMAIGAAAAIGGLAIGGGAGPARTLRSHARQLLSALLPCALGAGCAGLIAGQDWRHRIAMTLIATLAAVVSRFGFAASSVRFILCLLMTWSIVLNGDARVASVAVVITGGLLAVTLHIAVHALARLAGASAPAAAPAALAGDEARVPWGRWLAAFRQTILKPQGLQYPLRIFACLGAAALISAAWPLHHPEWIALTVAIVVRPQLDAAALRTTQRALGTVAGVAAGSAFVFLRPSSWAIVLAGGIIGALRPWALARSYLAYTAIMTPFMILMLDIAHPPEPSVLLSRLAATLTGAGIVVLAGAAVRATLLRGANAQPPRSSNVSEATSGTPARSR
jgi:hypothetical protein